MIATVYHVNAIAINSDGKPIRFFTGSPLLTLKECDNVVDEWINQNRKHTFLISWVEVKYASGTSKVVHLKEYKY